MPRGPARQFVEALPRAGTRLAAPPSGAGPLIAGSTVVSPSAGARAIPFFPIGQPDQLKILASRGGEVG